MSDVTYIKAAYLDAKGIVTPIFEVFKCTATPNMTIKQLDNKYQIFKSYYLGEKNI